MPPRKSTSRATKRSGTSKKMRGRGVGTKIMSGLKYIKDNKLLSQGLGMIPYPAAQVAAQVANMAGLGRKRRKRATTRRRKSTRSMTGRGIFTDFGSGVGNIFGGLGGGLGSVAHGLFGSGRRGVRKGRGIRV